MNTHMTLRRFRCFKHLDIGPLTRVNLIAGANNVGKTALLEAAFLHAGPHNPLLPLQLSAMRGIEEVATDAHEAWGWLFFDKDAEQVIELDAARSDGSKRTLRIELQKPEKTIVEVDGVEPTRNGSKPVAASVTTLSAPAELVLDYHDTCGPTGSSTVLITKQGIKAKPANFADMPTTVFLSTHARFPAEDARRFSRLEATGREHEIIKTVQILESRLRRLAVLVGGTESMIHGDLGLRELVPVPMMGEGVSRLLQIVLAISNASGGSVLIDEIENGLHHSVMVKVWRAVGEAASQWDVQILATTHSWECIRAAHEAFDSGHEYDFSLHRLERIDDQVSAMTYDQEALAAALRSELEVR